MSGADPRPALSDPLRRDAVDGDDLRAATRAGNEAHVALRHAELVGKQPQQRLVRGTVDRWGRHADPEDPVPSTPIAPASRSRPQADRGQPDAHDRACAPGAQRTRSPKIARPTRTIVAPSSTATS